MKQLLKNYKKNGIKMSVHSALNKEYLHECFLYDNGKLYWKERPLDHFKCLQAKNRFNNAYAGKLAGNQVGRVSINKINYHVKKVIWIMLKKEPCPDYIGFKDFDKQNTKIENLLSIQRGEMTNRATNTGYSRVTKSGTTYLVQFRRNHFWKRFAKLEYAVAVAREKSKEFGYAL